MKYLKVHVRGGANGEMVYPAGYQDEIGMPSIDHLYYEVDGACKLLLVYNDVGYKTSMIRTDVEELTEAQALAISEANETRTETILDEAKLRRLELKAQIGMTLTKEELDSVDPTKPDSIFGVSKILADKIVDLKAKEIK